MAKASNTAPVLTVSVAAELAGMHAQTVRQYDRLGLVVAKRTRGGGRRYSLQDVERLSEIQRLSQEEGINLAGISRIFELRDELEKLAKAKAVVDRQLAQARAQNELLQEKFHDQQARQERVIAVNSSGQVAASGSIDMLRRTLRSAREDERQRSSQTLSTINEQAQHGAVVPSPQQLDWLIDLLEQHMNATIAHRNSQLLASGNRRDSQADFDVLDVDEVMD